MFTRRQIKTDYSLTLLIVTFFSTNNNS